VDTWMHNKQRNLEKGLHQENQKALVGLATRPNQSQTRADKTKPDQKDDQSTRGPLLLKPEVVHNAFFSMKLALNHRFSPNQNNKTKSEHQSLPVLLMWKAMETAANTEKLPEKRSCRT
jgi:hypothetical protein